MNELLSWTTPQVWATIALLAFLYTLFLSVRFDGGHAIRWLVGWILTLPAVIVLWNGVAATWHIHDGGTIFVVSVLLWFVYGFGVGIREYRSK